jgi:hypothetical protein
MATTNFNTENRTYRQLMGNGLIYRVPRFQRDYSWGEEEWEDLWQDIQEALSPEVGSPHYMGYLVLQTQDNRHFDVIDGQQRLTTISLIILAAMRVLQAGAPGRAVSPEDERRLAQLRSSYIGYLDPVSLVARNKLSLNRNNDSYYKDYLVTLAQVLPQRGFPASTHALRKAFEWYSKKLADLFRGTSDPGPEVARFVESVTDHLFFTVITVSDEINAYKVFETLNARGVRLSATDLLKNLLFSVLSKEAGPEGDLEELERRWEVLVGRLGSESVPDFLRTHWNSRKPLKRETELFKSVRGTVRTREEVFRLIREMDEDVDTYLALTQPESSSWGPDLKRSASELRMFSVRQPFAMLLAARRKLSDADFEGLLRACVVISLRYNVIGGYHTGEQEQAYHAAAMRMQKGEVSGLGDVLLGLRGIYVTDRQFHADFSEKILKTTQSRNAKIVRYILTKIEAQLGGTQVDGAGDRYSLEHIFPQWPGEGWDSFTDRDREALTYRLGNMVLLEKSLNQQAGNSPYVVKRPLLQQSQLEMNQILVAEFSDWTAESISKCQVLMANAAKAIWKISQLSN